MRLDDVHHLGINYTTHFRTVRDSPVIEDRTKYTTWAIFTRNIIFNHQRRSSTTWTDSDWVFSDLICDYKLFFSALIFWIKKPYPKIDTVSLETFFRNLRIMVVSAPPRSLSQLTTSDCLWVHRRFSRYLLLFRFFGKSTTFYHSSYHDHDYHAKQISCGLEDSDEWKWYGILSETQDESYEDHTTHRESSWEE